ncbi:MAG: translocation/assembly module TamB domain-containing protein [Proteobacteria bacterium]|nr:translocation/assembly module TamB domain-containing protein [Pseudomonadota bacterium]
MTGPSTSEGTLRERAEKRLKKRRFRLIWLPFWAGGGLVALVLTVLLVARFAILTETGRNTLVGYLDGLELSRFGTLQLEGLSGDVLGDFKVERLAVVDEKGVWIEGRDVAMRWKSYSLLRRRLWAESVTARELHVFRRPILEEKEDKPEKDLPVSIRIDDARFRLVTDEAATVRRGDWSVRARTRVAREGPIWAQVDALSLLRPGDGLTATVSLRDKRFLVTADAIEKAGGALAGGLGLPVDQPFVLRLRADGRKEEANLQLQTRAGGRAPVVADGRWDSSGGHLRAGLDLTASSLTRPFVDQVGDRLGLAADIDPDQGSFYVLNAAVSAANLRATAAGRVNMDERSAPGGLRITAGTGSLTQLVGTQAAGAAEIQGVLTGGLDDFRFEGESAVNEVVTPDFRLANVSGPLRLVRRNGELAVGAELQGRGGQGTGVLAALLGGAPRANLEAARLKDGRILVRSLEAVGSGLRVKGSGSRGLLGGLTFQGEGALSNLAVARPGARGGLTARFQARQGGGGRPWSFRADARGQQLRTGLAELDRLLGPTPRLQIAAEYGNNQLRMERAVLNGSAGELGARGTVGLGGGLDLALNWRANGPFQAGPVEIAGRITGEGTVDGSIASPRADLTTRIGVLDLERIVLNNAVIGLTFAANDKAYNGFFRIRADSEYGPARGEAGFRFAQGGIDLRDVNINAGGVQAAGNVSLRNGAPTTADFRVAAGPGAFLSRGSANGEVRIVDAGGGLNANVRLDGRDLAFRGSSASYIDTISFTANGPLTRLPFTVAATGAAPQPYRLNGQGIYARQGSAQTISMNADGRVREFDLRTLEPAVIRIAGPERSARLRVALGGGTVSLDGRQSGETVDARAAFQGLNVGTINEDFAGQVNGTATLAGRGARLNGRLDAQLVDARSLDAPRELAVDGRVQAVLNDNRLAVNASATNQAGLRANVDAVLPTLASAQPLRLAVNRTQPISGDFNVDGELRPLWDLFFGGERVLAGRVQASGRLGGTLNNFQPTGQASLTNGQFTDGSTGLELRALTLRADLQRNAVQVRQLTANDGSGGTINGGGQINLQRTGGSNFRAQLNSFRLIDNELAEADATGTITATRNASGQIRLAGDVRIDEAEIRPNPPTPSGVTRIDVIERNRPAEVGIVGREARRARANTAGGANAGAAPPSPIQLAINLTAPRRIFVRGRGLNVELALDAQVRGTINRPDLSGTARVVRGEYEFAGRRFEFDRRGTIRLDETPAGIRLDLVAVREDPTLTAEVRVRGTAAQPEITLTSRPQLPQDEILSQVLFGRSASQLSALEAAQLASALSGLAGGGGFDIVGGLREFAGLDRLRFAGEGSGVTVAGGKYISDNVYLEIIGGGREGAAVQVEYQVNRRLSIVSRLSGDTRVSVRYRREQR